MFLLVFGQKSVFFLFPFFSGKNEFFFCFWAKMHVSCFFLQKSVFLLILGRIPCFLLQVLDLVIWGRNACFLLVFGQKCGFFNFSSFSVQMHVFLVFGRKCMFFAFFLQKCMFFACFGKKVVFFASKARFAYVVFACIWVKEGIFSFSLFLGQKCMFFLFFLEKYVFCCFFLQKSVFFAFQVFAYKCMVFACSWVEKSVFCFPE